MKPTLINEYIRACYVKRNRKTPEQALFHGWATVSFPKDDNVMQQVYGIVEFKDGHVEQVMPKSIIFADMLFYEFAFLPLNEKKTGVISED